MKKALFLLAIMSILSCTNDLTEKQKKEYITKGKEIAQATMKNLGRNLMKQMKAGGTQAAIPFCNKSAYPLTEAMEKQYNVSIKRTALKLRNPKNSPNTAEEKILNEYLAKIKNGEKLTPIVQKEQDNKVHFYTPIKLQKKCVACHGVLNKQVTSKTDSILKSLYPNDKATGFKPNDLRGIWSISFNQ